MSFDPTNVFTRAGKSHPKAGDGAGGGCFLLLVWAGPGRVGAGRGRGCWYG